MPANPDTDTTYVLSGDINDDDSSYTITLDPSTGNNQTITIPAMGGASSTDSRDGTAGLVPAPAAANSAKFLRGDGTWATPTNTKTTAGAKDTSSKIFLIGATAQTTNPTTYSHDTVYVNTDGHLYDTGTKVSVEGHTHNYAGSSSAGGAATSANKVNKSLSIKLNGGTTEGTNLFTFDGSAEKAINITPSAIGAAASSHGTHVSYGTSAQNVGSANSAGTASTVSRSDHVHALTKNAVTTALGYTPPTSDTVYTHPAGSASSKARGLYTFATDGTSHISEVVAVTKSDITALGIPGSDTNTAHSHTAGAGLTISGTGGTTGTTTYSLTASGVTAGTYGPSSAVTGNDAATISVPAITVDEYGRITSIANKTYTSKNTTYSAGSGLSLSGTTFNHSNSITAKAEYGQNATVTPGYSGTFKVYEPNYDAQGHITGVRTATVTMPSAQTIPTTLKNPQSLKIGNVTYDGSAEKTITAADLGLAGAMVYKGTSSSEITDGGTQAPTIGGSAIATSNLQSGNVVLYGSKEFVWNGSKWELLGDEGSYKVKQDAVADPTASGTSKTFIDTISQDANGKITATKKTVSTMGAATASAAGSTGLVPAPAAGKQNSFLRGDGTWQTPYTHPSHTAKTSGLYKITVDSQGHVSATTAVAKSDITGLGIPGSDTNYYHTRVYSSGLKIGTGTGVSDMYVPSATGTQSGVVIMHPAANCTTFTSDDSTCTVAAVKKAVTLFTNDYAPTKTGGGASGEWGISITGSAGSVAWDNITDKPSSFTPSSHSHSFTYKKAATTTGGTTQGGTVAKTSITPSGTISQPTFTGTAHNHTFTGTAHNHSFTGSSHNHTLTPTTTNVYSITSVGTMFTATVEDEVLVLTTGTAPTRSSVIKAYTGMSIAAATQGGTIGDKTATGTIANTTATGTVSTPTFTGTEIEHNHTFTGSSHTHSITLTDTTVTAS